MLCSFIMCLNASKIPHISKPNLTELEVDSIIIVVEETTFHLQNL